MMMLFCPSDCQHAHMPGYESLGHRIADHLFVCVTQALHSLVRQTLESPKF